jgi:ribosome-associated protein
MTKTVEPSGHVTLALWRVRDIPITTDSIRLGQLLKLAGVIDSGAEVKALLAEEAVRVNGKPETRRGRQLAVGDEIQLRDDELRVVAAAN